jgi:hypothetical protein
MINKPDMKQKMFCLAVTALACGAAFADKFDVKPGLWETTTATEVGGKTMSAMPAIPPEVLAKMTPEQRARMQAMMSIGGPGKPMTDQSCVTEKQLEHGFQPETDDQQSCKVESMTSTGKTQEVHLVCTNSQGKGTGVLKVTATSRESYEGTMDMEMVVAGHPATIKIHMKGKWLGANCGSVSPKE